MIFNKITQNDFYRIPGHPIAYRASEKTLALFSEKQKIGSYFSYINGIQTGKNDLFVRFWFEVSQMIKGGKRVQYNKGGTFRKWYGNIINVVNWDDEGEEIRQMKNSCIRGEEFYFLKGLTWSDLTSGKLSVRYLPENCLFDAAGPSAFSTKLSPLNL